MKRIVIVVGIAILILSVAALLNQFINLEYRKQNIIYVGGTGKGNYSTIQGAINSSKSGATIYIYSGIYYEKEILINKNNIKIVGENKNTTIIDGRRYETHKRNSVMNVFANNTILKGFTIKNGYSGIYIIGNKNHIEDIIITDNILNITNCSENPYGLILFNSENNTIANNTFYNNTGSIILIENSTENIIYQNNITNNYNTGLKINNSSKNNLIYHNNFINNTQNAYDESDNLWFYKNQGNFWDDYNGSDENNDSLGDTPYIIAGGNNQDKCPLIKPFIIEEKTTEFFVDDVSLYIMLVIGMIIAIVFVIPIALYWRKKYYT